MTVLLMTRDAAGQNSFGLMPADDKFSTTLAVGVAQTFTIPTTSTKWLAIFSVEPGASVWFAYDQTAAVPTGSVAASTSELNPAAWQVVSGNTISAITNNTTAEVGVKFYALS